MQPQEIWRPELHAYSHPVAWSWHGFLAPGMAADVTVFDPHTVIDHATYEDAGQLSEGIRHVLVGGRFALREGKVTGEQGGRVLTRSAHMPSRPMTSNVARQLSVQSRDVTIELTQTSGARRAIGSVRLRDGTTEIRADAVGVLQTTEKWASFTVRVQQAMTGEERSALVIVEQADPFAEGGATVTIALDGGAPMTVPAAAKNLTIRTAAPAAPVRRRE